MSTFSCQCQNYRGSLVVTKKELYFASQLFRIELDWGNVKRVRLETQQVKGVPTSVLVVTLQHNEAIRLQATNNSSQLRRGSASRKYFFYGFQDLLGAEELVKHYLEQYRTSEKAKETEGREETDKGSSTATKRPEKTTERDDVSSSEADALKEDSLNLSRLAASRRPESEPSRTVAPLSFSGRRATAASTVLRPKVPTKLLTTAPLTTAAAERHHVATVFLKVYRHIVLLLVLVMLFLLSRHFLRSIVVSDGRRATQTAAKLLRDIDALAGATAGLESYDNQESLWRYNKGRKRLAELSSTYAHQLEATSVELMERYVAIQAKMATLRGQRAARVARAQQSGVSAPSPPLPMSSEFSTPKKSAAAGVRLATTEKSSITSSSSPSSAAAPGAGTSATNSKDTCAGGGPCTKTKARITTAPASTPKKMSLSRLRSDFQRWIRRCKAVWSFVMRITNAARDDSADLQRVVSSTSSSGTTSLLDGGKWVVYSEELGEAFRLTEWVAAAEDEDRRKCLSLTKDLLETVELTERIFAAFTSVFFDDRYRQLVSGEERGSHWLQPPQALRTITSGRRSAEKTAFSGDAIARMAMLRRFVASLVHNEPLVANQAYRRAAALQVAEAMTKYRQEEVSLLRTRNRGRTDNTTVLWRILSDMVVAPSAKPLQDNPAVPHSATFLRNSLEELRFWYTHESAWQEHVLTFFAPEEQANIRSALGLSAALADKRGLVDFSTQPEALQWTNVPLFRGLLCFEAIPSLHAADMAAAAAATKSEGLTNSAEEGNKTGMEGDVDGEEAEVAEEDEETHEDDGDIVFRDTGHGSFTKMSLTDAAKVLPAPKPNASSPSPLPEGEDDKTHSESAAAASASTLSSPADPTSAGNASSAMRPGSNDLWKEVKLRWMADLEVFRLAFDPHLAGRVSRSARSYRMDVEERRVVADAAEVRRHLFSLLTVINENYLRYMTPNSLQRLGRFLRGLLPPYSSSRKGSDVYVSAVQAWGTQDPAVQLATAQVTGLALGTTHDVSGSLLYLILQPPPLLQTSMQSTRKTMAAAMVLILFVIVLAVLHFMQ